ncbi:MAG: AzlC family ABC transporter permease [Nitriliruptorales bacterium]|nr:AzlC family ABC transporter permease [Nitriliruptorales bacterium]
MPPTEIRPVRRAVLDTAPLILGYLPFGLVLGATIAASSVSDTAGWASSLVIFAGASQLAAIDLLDSGAAIAIVILTALVINLRHVMYSGALAPWFRDQPTWFQFAGPFVLADPVYSLSVVRFPHMEDTRSRRTYYATLGGFLLVNWIAMTGAGILLGNVLPEGVELDIAIPLVFLALLVPMIEDRPTLVAAIVGGTVTIAGEALPLHLGLFAGALSGVAAGLIVDPEVGR